MFRKLSAWPSQDPGPDSWVGMTTSEGEVAGALTREHGGHEGREHEEQHGEEQEAGVTQDLLGFVPNAQVEQADEEADANVGGDPQVCQDLGQTRLSPHAWKGGGGAVPEQGPGLWQQHLRPTSCPSCPFSRKTSLQP